MSPIVYEGLNMVDNAQMCRWSTECGESGVRQGIVLHLEDSF